jgi:hypothetical protein
MPDPRAASARPALGDCTCEQVKILIQMDGMQRLNVDIRTPTVQF